MTWIAIAVPWQIVATWVYLSYLVICCLYGLVRGGAPERIAVAILVSAVAASSLTPRVTQYRFEQVDLGLLAVDTLLFAAVVSLATKAQRWWPMWWAAVKANSVLTHLLMFVPILMPWSYSVGYSLWSIPSPLIIAIGTMRHQARRKRFGSDPAWRVATGAPSSDSKPI